MANRPDEPRVFDFVSLLRALAALSVFYFHFQIHILCGYPERAIDPQTWTGRFVHGSLFDFGRYGVAVFFIISGFLIPSTLSKPGASVGQFASHRFFRLYPAYWISILLFLAMAWLEGFVHEVPIRTVLVDLTMLQKFVGVEDLVGVFWTLQIEMIFYGLCVVLFLGGLLERRLALILFWLGAALFLATARNVTGRGLPVAVPLALSLMFLGDTFRAYTRGAVARTTVVRALGSIGIGLIPICFLGYGEAGLAALNANYAAVATFLAAYKYREWIGRDGRVTTTYTYFSDISYSIYLLHAAVGLRLAGLVFKKYDSGLWAAVIAIASTLLLSTVVYRLVELPCIRLGKRLTRRGASRRHTEPITTTPEPMTHSA